MTTKNTQASTKKAPASTHDIDRAHESRVDETTEVDATHQRPLVPWERPSNLDAPPPQDGMVQRWVRVSSGGEDDPRNVSRRRREGWVPRPLSTIPSEYKELIATRTDSREGVFVVDDLMLCEQPVELSEQRKAYVTNQTRRQMQAVEHDLENSQVAGHPITREHRSNAVGGRRLAPARDED